MRLAKEAAEERAKIAEDKVVWPARKHDGESTQTRTKRVHFAPAKG